VYLGGPLNQPDVFVNTARTAFLGRVPGRGDGDRPPPYRQGHDHHLGTTYSVAAGP